MIRTLLLCGLIAAPLAAAQAQTPNISTTSTPATAAVDSEPVRITGCEGFGDDCAEEGDRAASLTGSGAYIDQIGSGNRTTIAQRRGSTQSYARVSQAGRDNEASITQDADSAFASIAQSGSENLAAIGQRGTAHNTAVIGQMGNGNQASISQTSDFIGHVAELRQTGDRNTIALSQSGENNSAILAQNGNDNTMGVDQTGSNNALTWVQNGSGLSGATVTMDGVGRALTIMQSRP
jgi:hypothetical protein